MAQLASAPDCGSGGRGFESLYPPSFVYKAKDNGRGSLMLGYRQAVRHSTLTAALAGSNPASPVKVSKNLLLNICGILAQVVEHLTFNQVVRGSNPRCLMFCDGLQTTYSCGFEAFYYGQKCVIFCGHLCGHLVRFDCFDRILNPVVRNHCVSFEINCCRVS